MLLRSWGKYGVCHCTGYLFSSLNNDCPGAFVRKGANKRSSQFVSRKPSSLNYCVRTCTTISLSLWTVYSTVATSGYTHYYLPGFEYLLHTWRLHYLLHQVKRTMVDLTLRLRLSQILKHIWLSYYYREMSGLCGLGDICIPISRIYLMRDFSTYK